MRLLILSVVACLALVAAQAQQSHPSSNSGGVNPLPVGQVTKQFIFPYYDAATRQLKFTLSAAQATGITVNRAETTDLKIDIYENGKVTTTITSPDADLFVADRKMRTNKSVKIDRADLTATAKFCDFDLASKQYTLRTNVKVVLKNFDVRTADAKPTEAQAKAPASEPSAPQAISSIPPMPAQTPGVSPSEKIDALLESPGMYSSTNRPTAH